VCTASHHQLGPSSKCAQLSHQQLSSTRILAIIEPTSSQAVHTASISAAWTAASGQPDTCTANAPARQYGHHCHACTCCTGTLVHQCSCPATLTPSQLPTFLCPPPAALFFSAVSWATETATFKAYCWLETRGVIERLNPSVTTTVNAFQYNTFLAFMGSTTVVGLLVLYVRRALVDTAVVSWAPLPMALYVYPLVALHDGWFYLVHRVMHRYKPLYRNIHYQHHVREGDLTVFGRWPVTVGGRSGCIVSGSTWLCCSRLLQVQVSRSAQSSSSAACACATSAATVQCHPISQAAAAAALPGHQHQAVRHSSQRGQSTLPHRPRSLTLPHRPPSHCHTDLPHAH
jgi:hypothetical protein